MDNHHKILVVNNLIDHTLTYEAGFRLFEHIKPSLLEGTTIGLDFSGTGGLPSSFLHGVLAESFELIGVDKAKSLLKITGVTKSQAEALRDYVAKFAAAEAHKS